MLFWQNGYEKTTIKDIAYKCGFEPGNIYNYFHNKEHILYEVLRDEAQVLVSEIEPFQDNQDGTPPERLQALIKAHFNFAVGMRRSYYLLYDTGLKDLIPEHRKTVIALRDSYDSILRDIISDGVKSGHFANLDKKLTGFFIASILVRSRIWFSPKGRFSSEEAGEAMADFILKALQK